VPESTTLDDLEQQLRTLLQNACVFEAQRANLNEERAILSAAEM